MIRIFLVGDQPSILKGLNMRMALESDLLVVGKARINLDTPRHVEESQPDVLILNLDMSLMDCNHFVEDLRSSGITIPIIILGFDIDLADCEKIYAGSTIRLVKKQTSLKELISNIRQSGMQEE